MNEANREHLSALADSELERDQVRFLLRRMDHDAELRAAWSRYHVAGASLRRELPSTLAGDGFADRVMAALESSPHAVAGSGRRRWLQWSAGGAIAAGVAAVALMIAQPQAPTGASSPAATDQAVASVADAAPSAAAPSHPTEVPRWLMDPSRAPLAEPAAATVYGGQGSGNAVLPVAYSRQMAPYMTLRSYRTVQPSGHGHPAYVWSSAAPASSAASPRAATLH